MQFVTRAARRAGLVLIAALSVAAGAVALWGGLSPETFASARTVDLLIVLGLLLLPAATFGAVIAERRTRRRRIPADTDAPIDWLETPSAPRDSGPSEGNDEPSRHGGADLATRVDLGRHRAATHRRRPTGSARS